MHQYFVYCRKSTEDDDHQAISLESQRTELLRFAAARGLHIKEVLSESRSAKAPGRPVFNHMMARVRGGEAHGIIAWHPDRLARNAVDGGQVIHFLDTGWLLDLQFPTYTFEEGPQGKFMLAIVFGYSKYQVDTLSANVRRGNRTKREIGWLPNRAPIGYMNARSDIGVPVIANDPDRFPAVKRLWELFLTGQHSVSDLAALAAECGLRTRSTWRIGSQPFTSTALHRLFRNPFYTGNIVFNGEWFPGKHEPMITVEEFNRAQVLLRRRSRRYARKHFVFGHLIRCGVCDAAVTAEEKLKPSGRRYVYYHCARKDGVTRCPERSIEERELERQLRDHFHDLVGERTPATQLRHVAMTRGMSITLKDQQLFFAVRGISAFSG